MPRRIAGGLLTCCGAEVFTFPPIFHRVPLVAATPHTDKPALSAIALFLDVDGTLLEIAARPQAVSVPAALRECLRALALASGGALALVSGRAIPDLDALFAPLTLPAAGLHGFEHRGASGIYRRRPVPSAAALEAAREAMSELARRHGNPHQGKG